jgi:hypothetical protein
MPVITGTSGKDTLQGSADSDTLTGGAGADLLNGGLGADTYVFSVGGGADTISDFQLGIDRLSIASGSYNPWLQETTINGVYGTRVVYNAAATDTVFIPNLWGAKLEWLLDPAKALAGAFAPLTLTAGTGPDSLVLKLNQDAWQGSAKYIVKVDGVQIGGTFTASALRSSG